MTFRHFCIYCNRWCHCLPKRHWCYGKKMERRGDYIIAGIMLVAVAVAAAALL